MGEKLVIVFDGVVDVFYIIVLNDKGFDLK